MSSGPACRHTDVPPPDRMTTIVIVCGDTEVTSWPWAEHGRPDLSTVDELARLALAVRGLGWSVRVHNPSGALRELLDLVGLARTGAPAEGSSGEPLVVEVGGEAEQGEEVGVEERVEGGDSVP
jgi:hypothetical protein